MKYARIVNNTAVDTRTESPEGCFTPGIVAQFVEVPDQVENGWTIENGVWSAPAAPAPVPPPKPESAKIPLIGPIAFQMLFKVDELVAIDAAKETNAAIRIFWKLLDDPRTDYVDRNLEPVQTMLRNLEAGGLLATGRAEEIIHWSVA